MPRRARKQSAREPLKDIPNFALAPPNTPKWLTTRDVDGAASAFDLVEIDAFTEPDDWEEVGLGWKWEDFVWGYSAYSEHPRLVLDYYHELDQGTVALSDEAERARLIALRSIQIRHKNDAVWWTDLDHGPIEPVTLFDLTVFQQPRIVDGRPLWMLSLSQFDNAEWPPESQGGPPYTKSVSVARAAEDRQGEGWPPTGTDAVGVLHTHVDAPRGIPSWLESGPGRVGALVAIRINVFAWIDVFRADGFSADQGAVTSEPLVETVERYAKFLLAVLEGAHRHEGDGSIAPNNVYIDAYRYSQPRVRFARYGKGKKHGLWAGLGFYKKESIRELLQAVVVEHDGSTVWLYDLEAGRPDRVLTLWELIGDWFVDVDGKRIGARQNTGAFGPLPVYFIDMVREPGTVRSRAPEKKLWPMSEAQWESGEWPPENLGGPPAARYGMEMAREKIAAESDASTSALICMGRHIIFEFDDCDDLQLPGRWGMLRDPDGKYWPKCSLLFTSFAQGDEDDDATKAARNYFGRNASIARGEVKIPPHDLKSGWHEVGIVSQIFYERAGTKAPGRFKHKFNDPRGWMWLVALFKRKAARTPVVLFEYDRGGVQALRLELPDGCLVDERGIALP